MGKIFEQTNSKPIVYCIVNIPGPFAVQGVSHSLLMAYEDDVKKGIVKSKFIPQDRKNIKRVLEACHCLDESTNDFIMFSVCNVLPDERFHELNWNDNLFKGDIPESLFNEFMDDAEFRYSKEFEELVMKDEALKVAIRIEVFCE